MSDISQVKLPDNILYNIKALSLVESVKTTDETPYQLRQTPITANRCLEKLIGVSCAFNQLWGKSSGSISSNGIDISFDKDSGICTVIVGENPTGYAQMQIAIDTPIITGHKYALLSDNPLPNDIELYNARLYGIRGSQAAPKNQYVIQEGGSQIEQYTLYLFVAQNTPAGTYQFKFRIHDLTACFGSEVADYLYGLENS